MKKFPDKLEKLNISLKSLREMIEFSNTLNLKLDKLNEAIRDSIIVKFEHTFELTRKTIKACLEEEGYKEITSPKKL